MQKNITITLSAASTFADAPDDLDMMISATCLVAQIEVALVPDYDATVVIANTAGQDTAITGDVSDDEIESIHNTVNRVWERGEWMVYEA